MPEHERHEGGCLRILLPGRGHGWDELLLAALRESSEERLERYRDAAEVVRAPAARPRGGGANLVTHLGEAPDAVDGLLASAERAAGLLGPLGITGPGDAASAS